MSVLVRLLFIASIGLIVLGGGIFVILPQPSLAHSEKATIQVALTGTDQPDCGTVTPCRTIKYAVEIRAQPGDQILVAAGVYTEAITISTPNIQIIGAGPENSIIDGQQVRGPLVTFTAPVTASTVFQGITVRNGNAETNGGGFYILNSSPRISLTIIADNEASFGSGGGLYLENSSPLIMNTIIEGNVAITGGGLYINGNSMPTLTGNTICSQTGNNVYNASANTVQAEENWWGTNTPSAGTDYIGAVDVDPAMFATIGIKSGGSSLVPLKVGRPAELSVTLSGQNFGPPTGTEMTILADAPVFANQMTMTTVLINDGIGIAPLTPTLTSQITFDVFHRCDLMTAAISRTESVIINSIYLPLVIRS